MVVVLKSNPGKAQLDSLISWIRSKGIEIHKSVGVNHTILGLVGDTACLDIDLISALDIVESVKRVQEPYKNANRKFHPEDTVVKVGSVSIGGGSMTLIAGPCSVESEEQICAIAQSVKESGAVMLRGGAFKPRTSPYSFRGMGREGLEVLQEARELTEMPIVSEVLDVRDLEALYPYVDIFQVGSRNMQNYTLLEELGQVDKPILLKRGLSATIEEWLLAAEYILSEGNARIILCERGIRTFEQYTRNTVDIGAVVLLKELTHLPVIVDPSHATGKWVNS